MSKSILLNKPECIICGNNKQLHRHHIFFGTANRKLSEEDGCWAYLCQYHHNGGDHGVHFNKKIDTWLKIQAQRRWEELYGTREEFIKRYGRNYIDTPAETAESK